MNVSFDATNKGDSVVFSSARGDIWIVDLLAESPQKPTQLTDSTEIESWPSFSPDGNSVCFAKTNLQRRGASIYTIEVDSGRVRRVTDSRNCMDTQPVYSPDGNTIAFVRSRNQRPYSLGGSIWDNWTVYTVDMDGKNLKRQTSQTYYLVNGLAFSSDSGRIFFTAIEQSASKPRVTRFTIDGDKSTVSSVQPGAGDYNSWCSRIDVNPSGDMVYISDRYSSHEYDVMYSPKAGQEVSLRVTSVSRHNKNPVLLDDGRVYFLAATEWNGAGRPIFSLWSTDTNGSKPRMLAESGLFTCPKRTED